LPAKTIVVLRLAAGSVVAKSKNFGASLAVVSPVLESPDDVTDQQRNLAVNVCLQAGGRALTLGDSTIASQAYATALRHADESELPAARLGDAWAAVLRRDQPLVAAEKLSEFCRRFPSHVDAPNASRTSIECYRQAGDQQSAEDASEQLLNQWPDSTAAIEVIRDHHDQAVDLLPEAVQLWLIRKAVANDVEKFDSDLCVLGILTATRRNEPTAASNLIRRLSQIDQTGRATIDLLTKLPSADGERIAVSMLSADRSESPVTAPSSSISREAAARWAARTDRWSMLASAAESQQPSDEDPSRTVTIEQLFAEALTQVGRVQESKPWWNHLVDQRSVDDFATLVRCAEAETAAGDDPELAQTRIGAARDAAGDDPLRIALADLLSAELEIRRTKFDPARTTLQAVVQSSGANASIRARAQWLIGETYYLQQKFGDAIDSYRRVEEIADANEGGHRWISAALVQAGKSFEQLGRTRDAALCYGNLLDRFPDSAHARLASQRMAAIEPQRHGEAPNSSQPIRR
jgi:TolA-binding protein